MWNSLKATWRILNLLFWISTSLIVFYFLYKTSDGRFRFIFWQATPVVNGNAAEHEQVKPMDENPVNK